LHWVLVLGITAGLLEVIPNIGPILAVIPAVFSAAIFGSKWIPLSNFSIVLIVVGAYILIQQLENVLIVPRVMGNALEIHPVAVILGILILSSRIGFIGALIAAPVIGLLKVVLGFIISKLRGEDPYPELYLPKEEEAELANG
jgi:predicted PurR-regulated permease PerM